MKGKHRKKASTVKCKANIVIVAIAVLVMVACGAKGALAWFGDTAGTVTNIFTLAKVDCNVNEKFQNNIKENVKIQNTGDTEAYIRVALVFTWKNTEGIAAGAPQEGTDYDININNTEWVKGDDGFYYCKIPIKTQDYTPVLINRCTTISIKQGCSLQLDIAASAIQSRPVSAVQEAWGVTLGTDGTISKGGKR